MSFRTSSTGARLRELLAGDDMLFVPAVTDAFGARTAEQLGFDLVYLGGGTGVGIAMNAVPDMTIVSTDQLVEAARRIARYVDIPLILDLDDGGGNALRVRRTIQDAEAAGIAGVHIEDTDFTFVKHRPPKSDDEIMDFSQNHILSREAGVQRVRAAVEARRDADGMVIIARTDGALISQEEALTRMRLYAEAGADMVFPVHLPFADIRLAVESVPCPVMQCPVRIEGCTPEEIRFAREGGLKLLLDSASVPYAGYRATIDGLTELRSTMMTSADHAETLRTVQSIIRYSEWGELADRYESAAGTDVPSTS